LGESRKEMDGTHRDNDGTFGNVGNQRRQHRHRAQKGTEREIGASESDPRWDWSEATG